MDHVTVVTLDQVDCAAALQVDEEFMDKLDKLKVCPGSGYNPSVLGYGPYCF
jgi:hypothetical protein